MIVVEKLRNSCSGLLIREGDVKLKIGEMIDRSRSRVPLLRSDSKPIMNVFTLAIIGNELSVQDQKFYPHVGEYQ